MSEGQTADASKKPAPMIQDWPSPDPIIESVVQQFRNRSYLGLAKYGTTLAAHNATLIERLEHLKQELMDAVNYIEWTQQKLREQA